MTKYPFLNQWAFILDDIIRDRTLHPLRQPSCVQEGMIVFLWFEWQIYQVLTVCGQHGGDSSLLCLVSQSVEDPEPPTILKHRLMLNDVLSRPYIVPDRVAWWKGITNDSVDGEFHGLTQGSH